MEWWLLITDDGECKIIAHAGIKIFRDEDDETVVLLAASMLVFCVNVDVSQHESQSE